MMSVIKMGKRDQPPAEIARFLSMALDEIKRVETKTLSIPFNWALLFLRVAEKGEVQMRDLEGAFGLAQSTISTALLGLSTGVKAGTDGHGLLESYEDPLKRSAKVVRLTHKGRALMERIARHFGTIF